MLVVTGHYFSGMSLIMRALVMLGIQVHGSQFPAYRTVSHRPKGFYEDEDVFFGQAPPFGNLAHKIHIFPLIHNVDLGVEAKIIGVTRNIDDMAAAQFNRGYGASTLARTKLRIQKSYQRFNVLRTTVWQDVPFLLADMDIAKANKAAAITAIANFVGVFPEIDESRATNDMEDV